MPYMHGIWLTDEEHEAFSAVPPGKVVFAEHPAREGWGDVYFDTFNLGWHERYDAQAAADRIGVPLIVTEMAAGEAAKKYGGGK